MALRSLLAAVIAGGALGGGAGGGADGNGPGPALRDAAGGVRALLEQLESEPERAERARALSALEGLCEGAARDDGVMASRAMLTAGRHRYRLADWIAAVSNFAWVRELGADEPSIIEAERMIGQTRLLFLEDAAGAIPALESMIQRLDASIDPEVVASRPFQLEIGLAHLGVAYESIGRLQDSYAVRERLVGGDATIVDSEKWSYWRVETARVALKLGLRARAIDLFDEALSNAAFGAGDGSAILYHRERIDALGLEETSDERVEQLDELWRRPEFVGMAGSISVGFEVAALRSRRGEFDHVRDVFEGLDARIEALRPAMSEAAKLGTDVDRVWTSVLIGLGQLAERDGRTADAAMHYLKFVQRFPTHPLGPQAEQRANGLLAGAPGP